MNSCILMAEIYDTPQLRHTPDGLEVTEMIVNVPAQKPDDPAQPLKVISWKNLAKEVHANYHPGDRIIIEGRLGMNTVERSEGFKEKRAELTAQKIHRIDTDNFANAFTAGSKEVAPPPVSAPTRTPTPVKPVFVVPDPPMDGFGDDPDPHDIPF